jgi:hypothetical protein
VPGASPLTKRPKIAQGYLADWAKDLDLSDAALIEALNVHLRKELPFDPLHLNESERRFLLSKLSGDESPSAKAALQRPPWGNLPAISFSSLIPYDPPDSVAPRTGAAFFTSAECKLLSPMVQGALMFQDLAKYCGIRPAALLERLRLMEQSQLFQHPFWPAVETGTKTEAASNSAPSFLGMAPDLFLLLRDHVRDARLPHELAGALGVDVPSLFRIVDQEIMSCDRTRRPDQVPLRRIRGTILLAPKEVERIKELVIRSRTGVEPASTRQAALERSSRRNDGVGAPDRLPIRPGPGSRAPAPIGAVSGDRLPLGVMSLAELERFDDPVVQIPFLSSLLELTLTILFPHTNSKNRGLIKAAYSSGRIAIRSVNLRELNNAMTIRNRIIHPISEYDEPPPSAK